MEVKSSKSFRGIFYFILILFNVRYEVSCKVFAFISNIYIFLSEIFFLYNLKFSVYLSITFKLWHPVYVRVCINFVQISRTFVPLGRHKIRKCLFVLRVKIRAFADRERHRVTRFLLSRCATAHIDFCDLRAPRPIYCRTVELPPRYTCAIIYYNNKVRKIRWATCHASRANFARCRDGLMNINTRGTRTVTPAELAHPCHPRRFSWRATFIIKKLHSYITTYEVSISPMNIQLKRTWRRRWTRRSSVERYQSEHWERERESFVRSLDETLNRRNSLIWCYHSWYSVTRGENNSNKQITTR